MTQPTPIANTASKTLRMTPLPQPLAIRFMEMPQHQGMSQALYDGFTNVSMKYPSSNKLAHLTICLTTDKILETFLRSISSYRYIVGVTKGALWQNLANIRESKSRETK
jgi:hypothetical protein